MGKFVSEIVHRDVSTENFFILGRLYNAENVNRYGVDQKKVNFVLDQLERCGFLHGVQHVLKNT